MKYNRLRFRAALLAATTIASMALASFTQAATPQDPDVGIWDCAISGAGQKGLATIIFSDDGTFTGYQILTANPKATTSTTTATRGTENTDYGRASSGDTYAPAAAQFLIELQQQCHYDGDLSHELVRVQPNQWSLALRSERPGGRLLHRDLGGDSETAEADQLRE